MKELIAHYRKFYRSRVIGNWLMTAVCAGLLAAFGAFEKKRLLALCVCGAMILLSLFNTALFVLRPILFKRKIYKNDPLLAEGFETARATKTLAKRLYPEALVSFSGMKIYYFKYSSISRIEFGRGALRVRFTDEKTPPVILRHEPNENPAAVCAVIKSRNPVFDVIINGKKVERLTDMTKDFDSRKEE